MYYKFEIMFQDKGMTNYATELKICVITAWIKKYKSIIKKKKMKLDKILSFSHDEFVLINNMPQQFNDIIEEIRNPNDK